MKVEVEKLPDCKQRIKIEVPQEEVEIGRASCRERV